MPAGESVNRARFRESSENVRSACPPRSRPRANQSGERRCDRVAQLARPLAARSTPSAGVHRYWIAEHIYDHGARVRSYEIVTEVRV